ncbi:MAG: hypothetical protein K9H49_19210 [Bacteroidales bacterium]|nr:hypothetical protein [Bacteroidales bacterium]MCF8391760.1 hypothetical protein [Bacteroidales bacterium]
MNIRRFELIILLLFVIVSVKAQEKSSFIDPRDGKEYKTIQIGKQIWMGENLSYNISGSYTYNDKEVLEEVYGRLYEWQPAVESCPKGWHLPDLEEWNTMINMMSGLIVSGSAQEIKNDENKTSLVHCTEFNSIPSGSRDPLGNYINLEEFAYYWTSTEGDSMTAVRKIISGGGLSIGGGYGNKTSAYSVRCVKD